MHPPLLILLAATSAAAFTIPPNQPDGTYSVSIAPDGTEVHALLDEAVEARSSISDKFDIAHKRTSAASTSKVECGGYGLPPSVTDEVNNAVDRHCGKGASSEFFSRG